METRKPSVNMCHSAGRVTAKLLFSWLAASSTIPATAAVSWADGWLNGANQEPIISLPPASAYERQAPAPASSQDHDFTLRHVFDHGLYEHQDLHRRLDIRPGDPVWVTADESGGRTQLGTLHARSQHTKIERLSDRRVSTMQSLYHNARLTGTAVTLDASAWTLEEVPGPNTTDKETVLALAKMSWNAYQSEPGTGEWQDATGRFNHSQSFGWEGDSLRGHIFADKDNSTIVVALKGTSPGENIFSFVFHVVDLCLVLRHIWGAIQPL